jgi:hypothetical protein
MTKPLALAAHLFAAALPVLTCFAKVEAEPEPQSFHRVEVVRWKDADTLVGNIQLFGDVWRRGVDIRADYDGWEVSKSRNSSPFKSFTDQQWAEEIRKGKAALAAVEKLSEGKTLYVTPLKDEHGIYGRTKCKLWLWAEGKLIDVKKRLKAGGHLRGSE